MRILDNKYIILSELAEELEVTNSALLQHLRNNSGLGEGAEKFGNRTTGSYLIPVSSVLNFLNWAKSKARKMSKEKLDELEGKLWAKN